MFFCDLSQMSIERKRYFGGLKLINNLQLVGCKSLSISMVFIFSGNMKNNENI